MSAICFAAKPKCYALTWSYGEICVGSNCCGQFRKGLKMWKARLEYHQSELERDKNFDRWIPEWEEIQRKNQKLNIKYDRAKIRACKKMIKYFELKPDKP